MKTSPLAIKVLTLCGAFSMMLSYSGSCNESRFWLMLCPFFHRKTGIGVSILPDVEYDGSRLDSPPACMMIFLPSQRHCSKSHVVPPPEPMRCPIGSEVHKNLSRGSPVMSWNESTRFGGSDNSVFMVKGFRSRNISCQDLS